MSITLYHRTSIGEARQIVERGFRDVEWDFGLDDPDADDGNVATGVWLADRPLGRNEGILGDALVEIQLDVSEEELKPFELEGLLWDARLWVASAEFLNRHARTRILEVDPRSSWWHDELDEDAL